MPNVSSISQRPEVVTTPRRASVSPGTAMMGGMARLGSGDTGMHRVEGRPLSEEDTKAVEWWGWWWGRVRHAVIQPQGESRGEGSANCVLPNAH